MFLETAIVIGAFGFLAGTATYAIYAETFLIRPMQRDMRDRSVAALREARQRRYRQDVRLAHLAEVAHLGTPYRAETVRKATVPEVVATGRPGLRLVDGQHLYSAEWLNDDAKVNR